ncbi:hypothetical protein [Mesorhizobium sp.]|uniref:hypothetical protein n=1 Tax=Mesorhizobium sp. TaxID=1871066 RepID=UPI000FE977A4|nr:hypothetical protein [Mesorhizobium sp.]RWM08961.1 MAG: hypothetical protein EOR71_10630 [Mesorhizobium sp.]
MTHSSYGLYVGDEAFEDGDFEVDGSKFRSWAIGPCGNNLVAIRAALESVGGKSGAKSAFRFPRRRGIIRAHVVATPRRYPMDSISCRLS